MNLSNEQTGTLTLEEVDQAVKEFVEKKIGKSVTEVQHKVASRNYPGDFHSAMPLQHTLVGYSFNVSVL